MLIKSKKLTPIVLSIIIVIVFNIIMIISHKGTNDVNSNSAPIEGMGFYIKNGNKIIEDIDINDVENYELIFINNTNEKKDFSLSILASYKQQVLFFDGKESDIFNFSIDQNSELTLPVKLPKCEENKSLVNYIFTFIPNPQENVGDLDISQSKKYLNYNFSYSVLNSGKELNFVNENKFYEYFHLNGLNIIPNLSPIELEINNYDIKQKVIKKDDEKVTIPLIIGGGNGTDYLVYCLVNGKQTLINGKYDLRYNIKKNMAINDVVDIDINSKGTYEVNFYIIENPEDAKINNNQIENSYRFTIIKE